MSSFAGIRSFFYRLVSVSVCLALVVAVAAPSPTPARGDAPIRMAVATFQNQAAAPAAVVNALSASLYQAVESSGNYTAVGGGPLALKQDLVGGSFGPALDAAAKAGADEVVVGNIVQYANGQAYYSLSIYRVASVMIVRSEVFTQNYPGNARAMVSAFAGNIATLEAPRAAEGTIYSTYNGELDADLGASQGFSLGQHFNVLRGGQKVAEANISRISDAYAVVTIVNASAGYTPAIGDRLVGLEPQPALAPVRSTASGFNPLYLVLAAGVALLALGHGGNPAAPNPQPTQSGGGNFFSVSNLQTTGTPQQQPITFLFTFSQPWNATIFDPSSNTALAYVTLTSQGSTQLRLNQLGTVSYLPNPTAATQMQLISSGSIIQPTDHLVFTFLDGSSNSWVDINGDSFVGTIVNAFSIYRRPLGAVKRAHAPPPVPKPPIKPGLPQPAPIPH